MLLKGKMVTAHRKNSSQRVRSRLPVTTPSLGAPPLLNQERSFKGSPSQMRRGGAPSDGVV